MNTDICHRITLVSDNDIRQRVCAPDTTLLEAMRASDLPVRKACRNGVCGLCRCRVREGEFTYHWKVPHGLWEKDIEQGFILPCIAYPAGDLVLDQLSLVTEP